MRSRCAYQVTSLVSWRESRTGASGLLALRSAVFEQLAGLFVRVSTYERGSDCVAVSMLLLMHLL